ncbi:MAG: serine/threonine protein kinase [Cyanobacteria bacterium REEB67]|nr:serine/threonine protein kinase [Cyanobacteria bacterium REEB67]
MPNEYQRKSLDEKSLKLKSTKDKKETVLKNFFGLDWGPKPKPLESQSIFFPKLQESLRGGLQFGVETVSQPAVTTAARQLRIDQSSAIDYLPHADFQLWFRPILWRVLLGIALSPFVVIVLGCTNLLTPTMAIAVRYLNLFKMFLTAESIPALGLATQWLSSYSGPVFIIAGSLIAYFTLRVAIEPDTIYISPFGLVFGKTAEISGNFRTISISHRVNWSDVFEIKVIRPPLTKSNSDYYFEFHRALYPPFKLRYGDILASNDRQKLLNTLSNRFNQWIDEEMLLTFSPPSDRQSYTELWLAELSAAPKRDRLTPLDNGAMLCDQKYQVINKIGVGGQGTVYLAFCHQARSQEETAQVVVLKEFLLPIFPDKAVRRAAAMRFQKEADLLTRLSHPQIVKLKDLFLEDHRAYLVLEHLEGRNLKEIVNEFGPLPTKEIYRLAGQMAEILAYLHEQEPPVVHRDFTPDNLILTEDGALKLIDFSVAQSFTSNVTGSVVGKPHYIAPEQFRGKPTVQSDIYSMGATLFFLATGKDPEPISTIRLQDYQAGADHLLSIIIEKATKMDVALRSQNARDILAQLPLAK